MNSIIDKKIDKENCEMEVQNHKPVECSEEVRDEAIRLLKTSKEIDFFNFVMLYKLFI